VQAGANLRSKYDVIVMPHQGQNGKSIVYEQPKLSKPLPYKKSDKFKSLGMYAETDDVRGGMGLAGASEFQKFVEDGGVLITLGVASYFPADFGIAKGVDAQSPAQGFLRAGAVRQQRDPDRRSPDDVRLRAENAAVSLRGWPAAASGSATGLRTVRGHVIRASAGESRDSRAVKPAC
jgi:hypothetical protein